MNHHTEYIFTDIFRAHQRPYELVPTAALLDALDEALDRLPRRWSLRRYFAAGRGQLASIEVIGAELLFRGGQPGFDFLQMYYRSTARLPDAAIRRATDFLEARAWESDELQ